MCACVCMCLHVCACFFACVCVRVSFVESRRKVELNNFAARLAHDPNAPDLEGACVALFLYCCCCEHRSVVCLFAHFFLSLQMCYLIRFFMNFFVRLYVFSRTKPL